MSDGHERLLAFVREVVLAYPEAYEESPWGDLAAKVRKKAFAFYGIHEGRFGLTIKLPLSGAAALERSDTSPAGYGLGRAGWVSARFDDADAADHALLEGWIEESYRAVAPKTLARRVPEGGPRPAPLLEPPAPPADAPVVVVVSDDPLRARRAVVGLAHRGLGAQVATTSELGATDVPAAAVLVDLGRSPASALEVAAELSVAHFDCPLLLCGIRDARSERAVREVLSGAALYSREPPGDDAVLDALRRISPLG